jgi:DNA-directed RNA polymerase specialized sigma24 family protein
MPDTQAMESEITPDLAAMIADDIQHLHETLEDPRLQRIALARMQGFTVSEISERLGWSRRSVERSLRLIRRIWKSLDES